MGTCEAWVIVRFSSPQSVPNSPLTEESLYLAMSNVRKIPRKTSMSLAFVDDKIYHGVPFFPGDPIFFGPVRFKSPPLASRLNDSGVSNLFT